MQIVRNNLVLLQNIQVSCMETTTDCTDKTDFGAATLLLGWISSKASHARACAHPDIFDKNGQNYTKPM
jgi:hypothetical protein